MTATAIASKKQAGPPAELVYRHKVGFFRRIRDIGAAREIVWALAERQLRSRYKQAILGFAWAIITPLALMIVFTFVFERVGNIETNGVPYPLFSYTALIAWTFFSSSVQSGANSIIININLINKIYCPRETFPLSGVVVAGIDAVLSLLALVVLFVIYGYTPRGTSFYVPLLLLVLITVTVAWSLLTAIIVVYLRDLRYGLPLLLQIAILATPVAYGFEFIPGKYRAIYSFLNPVGPVIDGLRRSVLLGQRPDFGALGWAALGATLLLAITMWLFKRMEAGIADVA